MFLKCVLFLFVLAEIDVGFSDPFSQGCLTPRIQNGRVRTRQRSKLVKFICFPGFTLAGNKYATCRNGEWDVPLPVCVKPGCRMPSIENGLPMISHGGAWVVFFCYPRHKLIGSSALYCDGRRWNSTAPTCVDTSDGSHLACNFEDLNLCGWTQDELHDFDWKRLNKKTPSSFLFTGPQYDHTYGKDGNGYYMYIESTSRLENETARLISPVYEGSLTTNGCFSFYYHMFGKTTGGLKIYQKPVNNTLPTSFTIFEKWGNQGDMWYLGVAELSQLEEDFQIVIEGIRGSSYTSDIAIDDVAILQGENCTAARVEATTPSIVMPDSCVGRCDKSGLTNAAAPAVRSMSGECGCSIATCVQEFDCCPDFFDICISFAKEETSQTFPEQPQTEKLIAETTTGVTTDFVISKSSSDMSTTSKVRPLSTTPKPPLSTPKPLPTTSNTPIITKTIPTPTSKATAPSTSLTTIKPTTKRNVTEPVRVMTTAKPTQRNITTSVLAKITTRSSKKPTYPAKERRIYYNDKLKAEKEQKIEKQLASEDKSSKTSGLKTSLLVISGLMLMLGAVWLVVWGRGANGRNALARLRGRVRHDPDVQYLHSTDEHGD